MLLWTGCLTGFLTFLTRKEVDIRKWTDCKLFYFLFRFGRHYPSMLLVLMSVEKCFAVYFPLKSKTFCTRTAKWAIGIVGVILAGYNLVYFFVVEWHFSKSSDRHICVSDDDYHLTLDLVDSILYSFGPFILMFISNFLPLR